MEPLGADVARTHRDHVGHTGQDAGEQDDGDAVADTELIDLLTHPHDKGRAGNKRDNDDQRDPNAGAGQDTVFFIST